MQYLLHRLILPLVGAGVVLLVFVIELPQLFHSQKIIHQYNNKPMKRLLKKTVIN